MWYNNLRQHKKVTAKIILEAIRTSCTTGALKAGEKLPPVRELAFCISVAPGTVARAYSDARQEGILQSHVGRGTFVTHSGARFPYNRFNEFGLQDQVINLALDEPLESIAPDLGRVLGEISNDTDSQSLLNYTNVERRHRHQEAGALWAKKYNIDVTLDDVLITAGGQHAILCALSACAPTGSNIAIESLAYPGIKGAADMLGLHLLPILCDDKGIIPDALEAICQTHNPKAVYLTPSLQNPTNGQLAEHRRKAIAAIAVKHDLAIIEDELRPRCVLPAPDAIACHAPERTIFIAGISKAIGGGLRIGYCKVPPNFQQKFKNAIWASLWMPSPLTAEIATRLIMSGQAEEIIHIKEEEAARRRLLVQERLDRWNPATRTGSTQAWIDLSSHHSNNGRWTNSSAVSAIFQKGVSVVSADAFWTGSTLPPVGIRLCIGAPHTIEQLDIALTQIAKALS